MTKIQITCALSAPARRAWSQLQREQKFDFVAELFFDSLKFARYREFAVMPQFYTTRDGRRLAIQHSQLPREEKRRETKVAINLKTWGKMKKCQSMGLTIVWQIEEILYFAFVRGILDSHNTCKKGGSSSDY